MTQQADGFVYVQTNDADHNEVVVFARRAGGELERRNSFLTGGKGSGEPHLPSQSSVLVDGNRLFVTNAGSDDVTVFSIDGDRLEVLDRIASGGSAPRSVAVHAGHVYVLNTGGEPNITGFELERDRLVASRSRRSPQGQILRRSHSAATAGHFSSATAPTAFTRSPSTATDGHSSRSRTSRLGRRPTAST